VFTSENWRKNNNIRTSAFSISVVVRLPFSILFPKWFWFRFRLLVNNFVKVRSHLITCCLSFICILTILFIFTLTSCDYISLLCPKFSFRQFQSPSNFSVISIWSLSPDPFYHSRCPSQWLAYWNLPLLLLLTRNPISVYISPWMSKNVYYCHGFSTYKVIGVTSLYIVSWKNIVIYMSTMYSIWRNKTVTYLLTAVYPSLHASCIIRLSFSWFCCPLCLGYDTHF